MDEHRDPDEAAAPPPDAPDVEPEGQAADPVAALESELDAIAAAAPVIPPLRPGLATNIVVFVALVGLGFLGAPPSADLVVQPPLAVDGGAQPPANMGPEKAMSWRHLVKSEDLELDFEYNGRLEDVRFSGTESGERSEQLSVLDGRALFAVKVIDPDDIGRRVLGSTRAFRLYDKGVAQRRLFIDDCLELKMSYQIARDEAGEDRRAIDLSLEFKNLTDERLSFGYALEMDRAITFPLTDIQRVWAAGVAPNDKGELELSRFDYSTEPRAFQDPRVLALMDRYRLIAIAPLDFEQPEGLRRQGRVILDRPSSDTVEAGLDLANERLRLEPEASFTHRYRVFFGAKSSWTVAGHAGEGRPDLDGLTYNGWAIFRFTREVLLDIIRGVLALASLPGLALLLVGVLVGMVLRGLTLKSAWAGARGPSLRPIQSSLDRAYQNAAENAEGDTKRKLKAALNAAKAKLHKTHSLGAGGGCILLWIIILPLMYAYMDAVDSGFALRDASVLWAESLSLPDRFHVFEKPLIDFDYGRFFLGPEAAQNGYVLTYRLDALNIFPLVLYLLAQLEELGLRLMGIKVKRSILGRLFWFALFIIFFYDDDAGVIVTYIGCYAVWVVDRLRVYRRLTRAAKTPL